MTEHQSASKKLSRRRALRIVAAVGAIAALPGGALSAMPSAPLTPKAVSWRGRALGADAAITLYHPDATVAERLIGDCVTEVRRLEAIFSLYDEASSLSKLNRDGQLLDPPAELVTLLNESQRVGAWTGGAFDVTVQPLWQLFGRHFSRPGADPIGPATSEIARTLDLVDYRALDIRPDRVRFHRPAMAITLNGIAQGFITDRVAERLKTGGVDRVLVDMGELRGLGRHPDGRPWRVGLKDPLSPGAFSEVVDIDDRAVASSGGYGTPFSLDGRHHHLFNPKTGASTNIHAGITVLAPSATLADALSTGFAALPIDRIRSVLARQSQISAIVTEPTGAVIKLSA